MTRQELAAASDLLASAADESATEAHSDRLADLSDQLETLAERDSDPDHGRLARIESALDEVRDAADDDVDATIAEALDEIHAYRETLEGV